MTSQKKSEMKEKFWLYAFRDHLANLQVYSNGIHTADLTGDGDYKLLIADGSKKLKTYAGTSLLQEARLLGVPSAVTSFNMETNDAFKRPTVAVAVGPNIFMYRNSKPLYRFTVPAVQLDPEEIEIWARLTTGSITFAEATAQLERKLDQGVDVSTRTLELLLMDTDTEKEAFVLRFMDKPLVQSDVVVCLASIYERIVDESQPSCLVYGTEKGWLSVLSKDAGIVKVRVRLPSTPVSILTAGVLEGSYRIVASCRDGRIYSVKDGQLHSSVTQPDAQPCGIARYDNLIAVITMANTLTYYNLKGKRQDVVFLPVPPTNITTIFDTATGNARGVIVALSNGEIRVYVGKYLQHVSQAYGTVTAMSYCRYGREDAALILALQNGSLVVELLHRNANLSVSNVTKGAPPPEQGMPIPIPRLSSVFATQTEREKEFAIDMYRNFQYDLCHLKLLASKSYLSIMMNGEMPVMRSLAPATAAAASAVTKAQELAEAAEAVPTAIAAAERDAASTFSAPLSSSPSPTAAAATASPTTMQQRTSGVLEEVSDIRFTAVVQGLGPVYKIKGTIQNVSDTPLHNLLVTFLYDAEVYKMAKSVFNVPYLVPGLSYPCDALVALQEGETKGEGVLALVLGSGDEGGRPLASTLVDLPEADLVEGM